MLRNTRKIGRLFEALEDRRMLAVSAAVLGGNLLVADTGTNDNFVVAGGPSAGSVLITGIGGTTINGSASATLTGFTGGVAMSLGSSNSVSIADLTIPKGLTILGGSHDTVDVGAIVPTSSSAAPAADTVSIGANLIITLGSAASVSVGAVGGATPDVTVGGTAAITIGGGAGYVTEDSTTVTGSELILTGTGTDVVLIGTGATTVTTTSVVNGVKKLTSAVKPAVPTISSTGVNVGGALVITVGSGNDVITEESLLVGGTESIYMGSGTDLLTIGAPSVSSSVKAAATSAAITQLLDEGGVAVDGTLDVLLGSGNTTVDANDLWVGNTLLVLGSPANIGFNFGLGSDFGLGIGFGIGGFNFGFGIGSVAGGGVGGLFGTQTDTISLSNVTAQGAGIFPGFATTSIVTIEASKFANLGVGLGTGAGSLTIGGTTTTTSTTLIGLGTKNTYVGQPGNVLAGLFSLGLTPKPTTPT